MRQLYFLMCALAATLTCAFGEGLVSSTRQRLNLDGVWQFQLDPEDQGEKLGWGSDPRALSNTIRVPGIWQTQGFGEPRGQLRHDYQGAVWYKRTFTIPAEWKGREIWLHVGGILRRAQIYLNGKTVGSYDGMMTAFRVDLRDALLPGQSNSLVIRVDNRMRSGKYTPVPQGATPSRKWDFSSPLGAFNFVGNWGGIYRSVFLESTERIWVDQQSVQTDIDQQKVTVSVLIGNRSVQANQKVEVSVTLTGPRGQVVAEESRHCILRGGELEPVSLGIRVPAMHLWSPEDPALYTVRTRVQLGRQTLDEVHGRFGIRKLSKRDNILLLNNRPYYLRGYSVGRGDPLEGMIPVSKEYYLKQFRLAKDYGFNHVRYHSMTPPPEAFEAADEVGILLHVELPVMFTGWLMPSADLLRREMERILLAHRNHPSLFAVALGNEFNLHRDFDTEMEKSAFLTTVEDLHRLGRRLAPHIFIMSNAGYPLFPSDLIASYKGTIAGVPTLKHESGGYHDSLPDIDLAERFTGVLNSDQLAERGRWVEENGLKAIYPTLRKHSERLQQMVRKWHFERVRSIPEFSGYQFWLLIDSPADHYQDSWEDGLLNYFGEPKAITRQEMQQINAPTVVLIGSGVEDRAFWADRGKTVDLSISHYSSKDLQKARLDWKLKLEGKTLHQGTAENIRIRTGQVKYVTTASIPPLALERATRLELWVELKEDDFRQTNHWSFWAFPNTVLERAQGLISLKGVRSDYLKQRYPFLTESSRISPEAMLVIASRLDWSVFDYLRRGGRVFLMVEPNQFDEQVATDYFPFMGKSIGTYVDPKHPALVNYPHQGYCDLQFFDLLEGGTALRIPESAELWMTSVGGDLGQGRRDRRVAERITPIVWGLQNRGGSSGGGYRRLAWLSETGVGEGKLLICTLRLRENLDDARPATVYLFDTLLRYALSPDFAPAGSISEEELSGLLTPYLH